MSEKDNREGEINVSIGGNLSGKQIAIGRNIQQTGATGEEEDHALALPAGRAVLAQLRHLLANYFDEQELRSLAFDLGVNYDSLPGSGTAAKSRELVAFLARENRLPKLIALGREQRPHAGWPPELSGG